MTGDFDPPRAAVARVVAAALAEDLGPLGDISAALLPAEATATAAFVARTNGVVAGRSAVEETFAQLDPSVAVTWSAPDGATVAAGTEIARAAGPLRSLLTGERTALNLLCHLSGVATLTRRFVERAGPGVTIWDTRKTTPGLRALEKAAVRAGGGANHRGDLSEMVLLKDNHLALLGIAEAVAAARRRWPARTVEVEADRLEQVAEAIAAGADLVLLDNMTPAQVAECVALRGPATRPLLEASGGVTLDTVAALAAAGVDLISIGALTHSAPVLDIGLDLVVGR